MFAQVRGGLKVCLALCERVTGRSRVGRRRKRNGAKGQFLETAGSHAKTSIDQNLMGAADCIQKRGRATGVRKIEGIRRNERAKKENGGYRNPFGSRVSPGCQLSSWERGNSSAKQHILRIQAGQTFQKKRGCSNLVVSKGCDCSGLRGGRRVSKWAIAKKKKKPASKKLRMRTIQSCPTSFGCS